MEWHILHFYFVPQEISVKLDWLVPCCMWMVDYQHKYEIQPSSCIVWSLGRVSIHARPEILHNQILKDFEEKTKPLIKSNQSPHDMIPHSCGPYSVRRTHRVVINSRQFAIILIESIKSNDWSKNQDQLWDFSVKYNYFQSNLIWLLFIMRVCTGSVLWQKTTAKNRSSSKYCFAFLHGILKVT